MRRVKLSLVHGDQRRVFKVASKFRGHEIECVDDQWYFCDSGEPVKLNADIHCGHCGKSNTQDGHDGCLGTLPGLMNACCGHGENAKAYAQFLDGIVVGGNSARVILMDRRDKI